MEEHISVRKWQKQYRASRYSSRERSEQCEARWDDWFSKDEALAGRLKQLAPVILGITEPCILDNYYLWLKNNCPVVGNLYDDVRFEPLTGERNGRYFLVMLNSPHEETRWTLYAERYGFDDPAFGCGNAREMAQYINQHGREFWEGGDSDEASGHPL